MTGSGSRRYFAPLGRDLARIGLGTVRFGHASRDASYAVLDAWVAIGGDLIDTAAIYGAGESERVLGGWMAARGCRGDVVILTKGAHPDPAWRSRLDPGSIGADLQGSLDRLATDRVDIYMLHRDDPTVPVGEIVDALHEHVTGGLVRSVGGSNWTPARLEAAAAYAAARGRTPLTSSSVYFGLAAPAQPYTPGCLDAWDPASRHWYATNVERWPLFAWSSQSGGYFGEGFDPSRAVPEAVAAWDTAANRERRTRAQELGRRLGASSAQVALAYVLSQPFRPFALAGVRDAEGLRAVWAATGLDLDAGQREWLAGRNGA